MTMKWRFLSLIIHLLIASGTTFPLSRALPKQSSRKYSSTRLQSSWRSHASTNPDASSALLELLNQLTGPPPNLAFLFVGQYHASDFESVVQRAHSELKGCRLVSVVAGGVIGQDRELDEPSKPSMAVLCGSGVDSFEVFAFNELTNPPPAAESGFWRDLKGSVVLFADPWSPMEDVLEALKPSVLAGGISVPTGAGSTVALDGVAMAQGSLIGISFQSMVLQVVVAQGCRPVGPEFTITASEGSVILELDSQPAVLVLQNFLNGIKSTEEKNAVSSGLVCGILANDDGDYLVRQIVGFVPAKGAIAVAGSIQNGTKLRFHVRDKKAAEEDLKLMMKRTATERIFSENKSTPVAAMQISCIARGQSLFGAPDVDLSHIKGLVGDGPVGGFYANGEIGPVGLAGFGAATDTTNTYLHGFTSVIALLCDADKVSSKEETEESSIDEAPDAWG